jgi:glycosyltransferase involved in cell wall biosynthesis
MKFLFVHQNFPGQYLHLVQYLARTGQHEIVFLTQRRNASMPGVRVIHYQPKRAPAQATHRYLVSSEEGILNGQEVASVALQLKRSGFRPDVMLGHCGWGETLYLKDVFPTVPLLSYFEFFYHGEGADVGFNPPRAVSTDTAARVRTKNIINYLSLDASDHGHTPTRWQQSLYPALYRPKISVLHEGIDTDQVRPDPHARFRLPNGTELKAGDEVLTYVGRHLEPHRGFPEFMRALPAILAARPQAQVVIVGADGTSYGPPPRHGLTWRQVLKLELGRSVDWSRIHFVGRVAYPDFISILQISRVHVYLTVPFVLSWSMLEAMAAGCLLVGSRTAPVEEMIHHGRNGLLVDFSDKDALAETVIEHLADAQAGAMLRVRARDTIRKHYDVNGIALPAMCHLLQGLTDQPLPFRRLPPLAPGEFELRLSVSA